MAEDFRPGDPDPRLVKARRAEIVKESKRQWESCLWTSTTLYEWLKHIRIVRKVYISAPIVLGGVAGVAVLQQKLPTAVVALLALFASIVPALADALKIQTEADEVVRLAAEFKNLQDRFRRNALLTALTNVDKAEAVLEELMVRMDAARASSLTPPERFFVRAGEKIKAGHYDFDVDGPTFAEDKEA